MTLRVLSGWVVFERGAYYATAVDRIGSSKSKKGPGAAVQSLLISAFPGEWHNGMRFNIELTGHYRWEWSFTPSRKLP